MWLSTKVGQWSCFVVLANMLVLTWRVRIDTCTRVSHFMVSVTPHRITLTDVTKTAELSLSSSPYVPVLFLLFFFSVNACHVRVREIRSIRQKVLSTFKLGTCKPGQVCLPSPLIDFYYTVVIRFLCLPRPLSDLCFTASKQWPRELLHGKDFCQRTRLDCVLSLFSIFGRPCVIWTGVPGGRCL